MKQLVQVLAGVAALTNLQGLGAAIYQQDNNPIPNLLPEGVDNSTNNNTFTLTDEITGEEPPQKLGGFEGELENDKIQQQPPAIQTASPLFPTSTTATPSPSLAQNSRDSSDYSESAAIAAAILGSMGISMIIFVNFQKIRGMSQNNAQSIVPVTLVPSTVISNAGAEQDQGVEMQEI